MNGQLNEILRDPTEIPVLLLLAGLVAAAALAWALGWLLPKVADAVPARFRTRVLTLVPALRLGIGLAVIVWAVPKVIAPTPQKTSKTLPDTCSLIAANTGALPTPSRKEVSVTTCGNRSRKSFDGRSKKTP